jgi:hypothetical protein
MFSAGTAPVSTTGKFVHGGPRPRRRRFQTRTALLVAGFDVDRLPFLFVGVAGFIALGHGVNFMFGDLPAIYSFTAKPILTVTCQ